MSSMTPQQQADALRKEALEKLEEAERIARLEVRFPGIQRWVGRWNKIAWYTKAVNAQVGRFDMRHNCGCCNDSPLEVWPYLETPDGKVYSDPPYFQVGERNYGDGDKPYENWEQPLRDAGIPETVLDAIGVHFQQHLP